MSDSGLKCVTYDSLHAGYVPRRPPTSSYHNTTVDEAQTSTFAVPGSDLDWHCLYDEVQNTYKFPEIDPYNIPQQGPSVANYDYFACYTSYEPFFSSTDPRTLAQVDPKVLSTSLDAKFESTETIEPPKTTDKFEPYVYERQFYYGSYGGYYGDSGQGSSTGSSTGSSHVSSHSRQVSDVGMSDSSIDSGMDLDVSESSYADSQQSSAQSSGQSSRKHYSTASSSYARQSSGQSYSTAPSTTYSTVSTRPYSTQMTTALRQSTSPSSSRQSSFSDSGSFASDTTYGSFAYPLPAYEFNLETYFSEPKEVKREPMSTPPSEGRVRSLFTSPKRVRVESSVKKRPAKKARQTKGLPCVKDFVWDPQHEYDPYVTPTSAAMALLMSCLKPTKPDQVMVIKENRRELWQQTPGHFPVESYVERILASEPLIKGLFRSKKGPIACNHCTLVFENYLAVAGHFDRYKIARPGRCRDETCLCFVIGFASSSELSRHMKTQHGSTSCKCSVEGCPYHSPRLDCLKRHYMSVHDIDADSARIAQGMHALKDLPSKFSDAKKSKTKTDAEIAAMVAPILEKFRQLR
ncbi:hypothetical protein CJU89_0924 [Yarrowia sp. B02]|nr:hypothetical protein CJU89_0924 [Yarrowia sp. B02]